MHCSKTEMYVHIVWATWDRQPWIDSGFEHPVYAVVEAECHRLGCQVMAIGGVQDHVHVVVRMHATVALAELVKQMKGVSSHLVRNEVAPGSGFRWQGSYGAFSVSRTHLNSVRSYVLNQKTRHQKRQLWNEWEQCGEYSGDISA